MADTRRVKRTGPGRATYAYCVVESAEAPDLRRAPEGLPGCGPVRALDAGGGLWILAADAPLFAYGEAAVDRGLKDLEWVSLRAVAHQRVVEHAMGLGAVLPMKLLTLFHGDDRARAHVAGRRRALRRLVGRVRGRREWGVRMSLDPRAAGRTVRTGAAAAGRGASRGTAYLLRKTRERTLAVNLLRDARQAATEAFEALAAPAADARRRPPAAEGLVLDAAYLVADTDLKRFQQVARRLEARMRKQGLRLTVTGPWPAYNFVGESA
jgi:hypothetical protein